MSAKSNLSVGVSRGRRDTENVAKEPHESGHDTMAPQPNSHTKNPGVCRTRLLGGTAIVECLMEGIRCKWIAPFRDGRICKHPSAAQLGNHLS